MDFIANRDFYAQNFCVKKETTDFKLCYGSCVVNDKIADVFLHQQEDNQEGTTDIILSHLAMFAQINNSQYIDLNYQPPSLIEEIKVAKNHTFLSRNISHDIFHPPQYL